MQVVTNDGMPTRGSTNGDNYFSVCITLVNTFSTFVNFYACPQITDIQSESVITCAVECTNKIGAESVGMTCINIFPFNIVIKVNGITN